VGTDEVKSPVTKLTERRQAMSIVRTRVVLPRAGRSGLRVGLRRFEDFFDYDAGF
jgi:hypothetical protein